MGIVEAEMVFAIILRLIRLWGSFSMSRASCNSVGDCSHGPWLSEEVVDCCCDYVLEKSDTVNLTKSA